MRIWRLLYVIIYYTVFFALCLILALPYLVLRLLGKLPKDLDDYHPRHIN